MLKTTRRTALKSGLSVVASGLAMPYIVRSGFAATPVRTLKLVFADTVAHPAFKAMLRFAENVKKKTDGAIAVDCYGAGQLGSESNQVTGLQTGIYDFAGQTSGFVEKVYPRFNVLDLPFLFSTADKAEKMLDGPVGKTMLNELPAKGIYGLSYGWWGWRELDAVNRAAPEPKDIQGLKIRVQPGAIFASTFTTLKAIPIGIDITEVYLALSDGTIQAVEVPIISVLANKLQEVLKVVTKIDYDYNVGLMMVSKRTFRRAGQEVPGTHSRGRAGADPGLAPDGRGGIGSGREDHCRAGGQNDRSRPGRPGRLSQGCGAGLPTVPKRGWPGFDGRGAQGGDLIHRASHHRHVRNGEAGFVRRGRCGRGRGGGDPARAAPRAGRASLSNDAGCARSALPGGPDRHVHRRAGPAPG